MRKCTSVTWTNRWGLIRKEKWDKNHKLSRTRGFLNSTLITWSQTHHQLFSAEIPWAMTVVDSCITSTSTLTPYMNVNLHRILKSDKSLKLNFRYPHREFQIDRINMWEWPGSSIHRFQTITGSSTTHWMHIYTRIKHNISIPSLIKTGIIFMIWKNPSIGIILIGIMKCQNSIQMQKRSIVSKAGESSLNWLNISQIENCHKSREDFLTPMKARKIYRSSYRE